MIFVKNHVSTALKVKTSWNFNNMHYNTLIYLARNWIDPRKNGPGWSLKENT